MSRRKERGRRLFVPVAHVSKSHRARTGLLRSRTELTRVRDPPVAPAAAARQAVPFAGQRAPAHLGGPQPRAAVDHACDRRPAHVRVRRLHGHTEEQGPPGTSRSPQAAAHRPAARRPHERSCSRWRSACTPRWQSTSPPTCEQTQRALTPHTHTSRLSAIFAALTDLELLPADLDAPRTLYLGIVEKDSSVVYYVLKGGIVSPLEVPE